MFGFTIIKKLTIEGYKEIIKYQRNKIQELKNELKSIKRTRGRYSSNP